jgi:hypothetical protein
MLTNVRVAAAAPSSHADIYEEIRAFFVHVTRQCLLVTLIDPAPFLYETSPRLAIGERSSVACGGPAPLESHGSYACGST